jgi:hypothetical protein
LKEFVFESILERRRKSTAKAQGLILSEKAAGSKISKNFKKDMLVLLFSPHIFFSHPFFEVFTSPKERK